MSGLGGLSIAIAVCAIFLVVILPFCTGYFEGRQWSGVVAFMDRMNELGYRVGHRARVKSRERHEDE